MPYSTPTAWRVNYGEGNAVLTQTVKKLVFTQSFTSNFSTATHIFATLPGVEGELAQPNIQEKLKKGELEFFLEDVGKTQQTVQHRHMVHSHEMGTSIAGRKLDKNECVAVTVEHRLRMHMEERIINRKGDTAADIVKDIVGRYAGKLSIDGDRMESGPLPAEFRSLTQNATDHVFVTRHLVPRSWNGQHGGYYIYTTDGSAVGFSTFSYGRKEVTLLPEEVLDVVEGENPFMVLTDGGSTLNMQGFDPMRKQYLEHVVSDAPEFIAKGAPMHVGSRQHWHPIRSQEAMEVWARAFHDQRSWGAAFDVRIRGRAKLGQDNDIDVKPHLMVDLSKTKYRDRGAVRGVVIAVTHEWREQTYVMTLHCVRNASDI